MGRAELNVPPPPGGPRGGGRGSAYELCRPCHRSDHVNWDKGCWALKATQCRESYRVAGEEMGVRGLGVGPREEAPAEGWTKTVAGGQR